MTIYPKPGVVLETDDETIKEFLMIEGRLAALEEPRLTGAFRQFAIWGREGMVFCAKRCMGYENPEDNGYVLLAVNLRITGSEHGALILQAFIEDGRDRSRPMYERWEKIDETVN